MPRLPERSGGTVPGLKRSHGRWKHLAISAAVIPNAVTSARRDVRVPPAPSLSGSLIGRDLLFAPPLACHPETIRRGWLKDLNHLTTDQQMSRGMWPSPLSPPPSFRTEQADTFSPASLLRSVGLRREKSLCASCVSL